MRPRPDAAENALRQHQHAAVALASMRPRPDAAENFGDARIPDLAAALQ